jgi:hypothetical protein
VKLSSNAVPPQAIDVIFVRILDWRTKKGRLQSSPFGGQSTGVCSMKRITKIVLNGIQYDGVDQMPPDVRRQYEEMMDRLGSDSDGDGVPDILHKPGAPNVVVKESFTYNGREYNSRDELPPEVRELLDHMPKPGPGEDKTTFEVKTSFEPQVRLASNWSDRDRPKGLTLKLSWFLVLLLAAVIVLLFLWFSGIKPSQLLPR